MNALEHRALRTKALLEADELREDARAFLERVPQSYTSPFSAVMGYPSMATEWAYHINGSNFRHNTMLARMKELESMLHELLAIAKGD